MRNKRERINFRITLTIAMVLISIISLFILINLNFISAATYQNGSDIYQDSSNWNGTYSNDNFTISAWIYLKNPGTSPVIYRPFLYQLLVNPNNKTELRLNNGTGFSSSGIIDLNSWTFVAASYNGTSINLYINNNNKTFTAYSGGYLKPSNTFEAIMGRNSFNYFNGTIDEVRVFNKALNENEINLLYYSNLRKYDTGKWLLNIVQTGLQIGSQYIYSFFIRDFAGLSNSTEIRTIKGNTAPAFILISYSPNSTDNMDPNINVNITANISDTDNNFDSGVLQWKNSTQNNWNNVTMLNLTVKSSYTILNGNFTLPSYEDNITLRILINDTTGDATLSNNYTLPNYWDCTWTATSNLGSTAGWDQNKFIGNITINNTGDSAYANNNCSLDFHLTHDLTIGRIYFNNWGLNAYYNYYDTSSVLANSSLVIPINATFLKELKQENVIITLTETYSRSNTSSLNTTAIIVSNQEGPYLYQTITSYPTSIYLTPGNFSLQGYLRNLMGSSTVNVNNTAYNTTFYWSLPSGLTNISGNLIINYTNITDNGLNYNNINASFSNLASFTPGSQEIYLYSYGYNLSGNLIRDAASNTLFSNAINISFLCYNVSDSICITSCGNSQDPDCPAASSTTTTTGSSGSGGGGGSGFPQAVDIATSADYQLVRGKQNQVKIIFENLDKNESITDIVFSVSGKLAKYIDISPKSLSTLGSEQKETIILTITSPAYIELGKQELTITMSGKKGLSSYRDSKKITLEIHELSISEANQLLNESKDLISQLNKLNISSSYLNKLLNKSEIEINNFNLEVVRDNYNEIKDQVKYALDSNKMITELSYLIKSAEEKGIGVSESKRLLELAKLSIEQGEFEQAYKRTKDSQLTYALEVKGEFGKLNYYFKTYPKEILLGTFFLAVFLFGSYNINKLRRIKRRITELKEEEKILNELIRVVQNECFKEKRMSMSEYETAMKEYNRKLSLIIGELIELETKRAQMLRFVSKTKMLEIEKEKIISLIKELQNDYMKKKKFETRTYEFKMESFNKKLSEIEEKLATIEAKHAIGFGISLRVPKEKN